ncbi:MAG: hypothetical protein WBL88_07915, partial [Nitrososphaeraceae archaeon]
ILKVKPSVGNLNLDNDNDDDDNKPITLIVDGCIRSYYNKERRLHRPKMDQEERVYQTTYCSRCKIKEGSFIQRSN